MTNTHSVRTITRTALIAALMSGSSLVVAQEAPVVTSAPEPVAQTSVPAEPKIAPPPLVRTLPDQNDVVNPAALEQAQDEAQARAAPAVAPRNRTPVRAAVRPVQPQTAEPRRLAPVADASTFNEPSVGPAVTAEPTAPEAVPSDNALEAGPVATTSDGSTQNDLPLFAGIAAALAAIGLGGLVVARRRRTVAAPQRPVRDTPHVAPRMPASPPAQSSKDPQLAKQQPRVRGTVNSRPDVPVTDPLFSRPVVAAPITDPMFAPRNDIQTPITDPLFAKHNDFAGRLRDTRPTPTRETV